MVTRQRGYTLLEIVICMAIFGFFLSILGTVTYEMHVQERRFPISMMNHPAIGAVMARIRRDVEDTTYYPVEQAGYTQTPQTLILYVVHDWGAETVVYDFTQPGEVRRKGYFATMVNSEWVAHAVPQFSISTYSLLTGRDAVRVRATDQYGQTMIDQIFTPRPHG